MMFDLTPSLTDPCQVMLDAIPYRPFLIPAPRNQTSPAAGLFRRDALPIRFAVLYVC